MSLLLQICFLAIAIGQEASNKPIRILFVGNSLTYNNDLPTLVEKVGKSQQVKIKTQMLAKPNYALEDHWVEGELQQLIASGRFDFVVVQQGPSSQPDGREMLLEYGQKIAALCEQNDTKLAFYMVWPAQRHAHTWDGVIANYTEAAERSKAILCPVGLRWKEQMASSGDQFCYGSDGFHPSQEGSQLAAEVIYESLSFGD